MALDRQLFLTALAAMAAGCDDVAPKCGAGGSGSSTANCITDSGSPTTEGYTTPPPTGEGSYSSYSSYSYYSYYSHTGN